MITEFVVGRAYRWVGPSYPWPTAPAQWNREEMGAMLDGKWRTCIAVEPLEKWEALNTLNGGAIFAQFEGLTPGWKGESNSWNWTREALQYFEEGYRGTVPTPQRPKPKPTGSCLTRAAYLRGKISNINPH